MARATTLAGAAALALAALAAPANAALTAVSPTTIPVGPQSIRLPQWYDDGAQKLTVCPAGDPNCGAIGDFTPPAGEAFYNRAVAKMTGPGGQLLTMVIAVEAAFDPRPGFTSTPVTFTRIRSKIQGGTPGSTYTVVEPFGTQTITTNGVGVGTTTDQVGCVPTAPGAPCDFAAALGGGVGPWLRWDAGAPLGYLGDGRTDHTITGSPLGTNFFEMTGPGIGTMRTDLFAITGKVFDPTQPAFGAAPAAFGAQRVGTTSAQRVVVVHNNGGAPMSITGVSVGGANAGDFRVIGDTCGAAVPANGSCNVDLTFAPSAAGERSATLAVAGNAPGSPHSVALSGTGTQSLLSATPAGVSYGSQLVGTTTAPRTVDIANGGTAPLNVAGVSIVGPDAGDYALGVNTCGSPVAAGAACRVEVLFTPGAAGVRNATLSLTSDGGAGSVSLSGTGVAAAGPGAQAPGGATTAGATTAAGATASTGDILAGSARPALALRSLTTAARVKQLKAKVQGIRLTMRLSDGTEIVKVNVYRKVGTRLRLLSSTFRVPAAGALSRVTQNQPGLRRLLKRGDYQVQVTPGYSKSELGRTSRASFKVV